MLSSESMATSKWLRVPDETTSSCELSSRMDHAASFERERAAIATGGFVDSLVPDRHVNPVVEPRRIPVTMWSLNPYFPAGGPEPSARSLRLSATPLRWVARKRVMGGVHT